LSIATSTKVDGTAIFSSISTPSRVLVLPSGACNIACVPAVADRVPCPLVQLTAQQ